MRNEIAVAQELPVIVFVLSAQVSAEGEDTMLMKSIAAGLAGTALFATVASAQNPTTTDKSPTAASTATTTSTTASGEWRASKMAGLKIYNDANENIGSINDLLMDKGGAIKIAVIGVGGFLGMGEASRRRSVREAEIRQ
ncbi:sporulation protein YlmC with PRC-barrel domain [Bradyrhizobium sp. LM3.4]